MLAACVQKTVNLRVPYLFKPGFLPDLMEQGELVGTVRKKSLRTANNSKVWD